MNFTAAEVVYLLCALTSLTTTSKGADSNAVIALKPLSTSTTS